MSDSEKDTKAETKIRVEVGNPATRLHYDPVPTPRALFTAVDEDGTREKSDFGVNMNENNDSGEEDNKVEKEGKKDSEKPLLDEESVTIEIKPGTDGEDTATLAITDKKKKSITESEEVDRNQKGALPVYLFPCTRIRNAWRDSTNICSFIGTAVCIIFQTVGWFTCVGGIPFLSLVMLIIGSVYIDECKIEPNIPVYLIVSGVIGTIQHVITIWTKYVPKDAQGRLKVKRSYCNSLNGLFHMFLMIWFIIGCVWVYGAHSDVDFRDKDKDEYCHKTLYYFAFWILNLSFILLAMVIVLSLCFLLFVVATPKEEKKSPI